MRVTQNSQYTTVLSNLEDITEKLADLQNQSSSGLKLNSASDDPTIIGSVMSTRSQIQESERYESTLNSASDSMDLADSQMETIENTLVRIKEIAVAASNSTASDDDLETYATEVDQLMEQLVSAGNAQINGEYLFAGYENDEAPFVVNEDYDPELFDENDTSTWPVTYQGDNNPITLQIGAGETVESTVTGNELFMGVSNDTFETDATTTSDGGINIFNTLAKLQKSLQTGDIDTISNDLLEEIDTAAEQNRSIRAIQGVRESYVESSIDKQQEAQLDLETILSRYQDADTVEVYSDLIQTESAYEAALSVASRISDISILDYL